MKHMVVMRFLTWIWKRRATLAAILVIGFAILLRGALVLAGWPGTDSDDSTMGLMARHIAFQGEHPIFFWGQAYMGSLEAHVAALFFAFLGSSPAALKFGLILLYALFLIVMYLLLKLLFNRRWAVIGLILLALSTPAALYLLLNAYGGYLETLLFGSLLVLLTCYLLRNSSSRRLRRLALFGAWGLVAGFGVYSDPLFAPFVAFSLLALIVVLRRELLKHAGVFLCLGFLLGISPWIIYVASAASPEAAKSFFQHTPSSRQAAIPGATTASPDPITVAETHMLGVVVIAIPNMTNELSLCPLSEEAAWPPNQWGAPSAQPCVTLRGLWGAGFLLLMLLTVMWESVTLRKLLRGSPHEWSASERLQALRAVGRLLAVAAPLLTILLFAISSASATEPWIFARYLVTLLIAFPVALADVGERIARHLPGRYARAGGIMALTLVIGIQAPGPLATFGQVHAQQTVNAQQMDLVRQLEARHDLAIYTEFWTCYRTAFLSNERIVCSVLDSSYTQKPNRYAAYDDTVRAVNLPVFVFPIASSQTRNFSALASKQGWQYHTTAVDNQWVIFEVTTLSDATSGGG